MYFDNLCHQQVIKDWYKWH